MFVKIINRSLPVVKRTTISSNRTRIIINPQSSKNIINNSLVVVPINKLNNYFLQRTFPNRCFNISKKYYYTNSSQGKDHKNTDHKSDDEPPTMCELAMKVCELTVALIAALVMLIIIAIFVAWCTYIIFGVFLYVLIIVFRIRIKQN